MNHEFVITTNYRSFHDAIKSVEHRGAAEARFVVVSGAPGRSKSTITQGWAAQSGAIHLRAMQGWTPRFFLKTLAKEIKVDASGSVIDLQERCFQRLAHLGFPNIVIDEFQHCLADHAATLEKVRDICDLIPPSIHSVVVLVAGDEKALTNVQRFGAISDRIGARVEFELATLADATLLCKRLSEVEIKPDLIAQILQASRGVFRQIVNAIATVEGVAKVSGVTSIDAAQFKQSGASLCVDWRSGSTNLKRVG